MFDATTKRASPWPGLIVVAVLVAAGAFGWAKFGPDARSRGSERPVRVEQVLLPAGPVADEATVRSHLVAIVDDLGDGAVYRVQCDELPCVATVRMPLPRDRGNFRNLLEGQLVERGWQLTPKGRVMVLDPRKLISGWLPDRAFYTFAMHSGPDLSSDDELLTKQRIGRQSDEASLAVGPW